MEGIWTNSSTNSDFFINAFYNCPEQVSDLYFAVAFFTDSEIVKKVLDPDRHLRMIVRLGFPTNPFEIKKIIDLPNVELRYYSNFSFHPKLYIFSDQLAIVGSANLTKSALRTNQEISVSIGSEDERFEELQVHFSNYWGEAEILTHEVLEKYESIWTRNEIARVKIQEFENEITKQIGTDVFQNINRGDKKKTKENIFIDSYRKSYQECVTAFERIRKLYISIGKRKNNFNSIPLRLEIDSFFSFVREKYATHETWSVQPLGWNSEKENMILDHINEWLATDWYHYDSVICHENYPRIIQVFETPEKLNATTYDQLLLALTVLHSFHDRLRFFPGGLDTLLNTFKNNNDLEHVKSSLTHLIFGEGDIVLRMADLVYDNEYKLNEFGKSNVQELVGWVGDDDLPVINGRTTKVLRYYGFDITQV